MEGGKIRYDNERQMIEIYNGTYRVETVGEGEDKRKVPAIYFMGRQFFFEKTKSEFVDSVKIYTDTIINADDDANKGPPVPVEVKKIETKKGTYFEIILRSVDEARKYAELVEKLGGNVYRKVYSERQVFVYRGFRPYFYVDDERAVELAKRLIQERGSKVLKVVKKEAIKLWKDKNGEKVYKELGTVYKIIYDDPRVTRPVRMALESQGFRTFEADVIFFHRFLIDKNFTINIPWDEDILYYDIEVASEPGVFPDPEKADWPVISIATMDGTGKKEIKILDPKAEGMEAIEKEMRLINWFFRKVEKYVVVSGWNSSNFDWPYLVNRAKKLNEMYLKKKFDWEKKWKKAYTSTLAEIIDRYEKKDSYVVKRVKKLVMTQNITKNEAFKALAESWTNYRLKKEFNEWVKKNEEKFKDVLIELPFMSIDIDLLVLYKKFVNHKLSSYKLDYIAKLEGFEGKTEFNIENILEIWKNKVDLLKEYNENDVEQTYKIGQKRELIKKFFRFANITGTPPKKEYDAQRGISTNALIDSLVLRLAKKYGYVLGTGGRLETEEKKKYSGGYVHEPEPGVYENVITLDFNSMYPSIIIAFNVSADTFDEEGKAPIKAPIGSFNDDHDGLAVLAVKILFDLKMETKKKLKKLKKELGPDAKEVQELENFYAGVKGVLNGIYGTYGYDGFRLFNKKIAENITTLGREIWNMAYEIAEKELGYKVVYGDSVARDSKVIIRRNGRIEVVDIEDLFDGEPDHVTEDGREYRNLEGVEALTLDESMKITWAPIKYIMRHRTNKKMYRVWVADNQYVDVTEDHSIFVYKEGKLVEKKPTEMNSGDVLVAYNEGKLEFKNVKIVEEIRYDDYVYDIEVGGTHKFFANGVLVHNTDSQYYIAKNKDPEKIIEEAEELAEYLTKRIREELKKRYNARSDIFLFEPDKIYKRLILFKKKNYAGLIMAVGTSMLDEPKFDAAGILSRGDVSEAQKEFLSELINMILEGKSRSEVYKAIQKWRERLMKGELDEKLVKWKALNKSLEDYKSEQTHVRAYKYLVNVRKIPPTELQKVGYVKIGPKAEDFIAVAPGDKVKINKRYYEFIWENQFQSLLDKYIFLVIPKIDIKTMTRQASLTSFLG